MTTKQDNKMQEYDNSVKRVNVINEFIAVFAQQGVVFTDDEIENIFSFYTHKLHGLAKELDTLDEIISDKP